MLPFLRDHWEVCPHLLSWAYQLHQGAQESHSKDFYSEQETKPSASTNIYTLLPNFNT